MKAMIRIYLFLISQIMFAQVHYGEPVNDALPEKLKNLPKVIEVNNFPKTIDPVKIDNRYYWKHNTAILCKESDIEIIEFGAYLFYSNRWNLRKSYSLKELSKNFGIKQGRMKQAQPYTWVQNWRTDSRLFGGWALWYFIGKKVDGELVCGYEKIETTTNLLK